MSDPDRKKRTGVSRRQFLKGVGGGIALTTVLPGGPALGREPQTREAQDKPKQITLGPGPVKITLNVNGKARALRVEPRTTLLEALRGPLDLTGAKDVCDRGECGACTVLLDGRPVYACMMLAIQARGARVRTVEALAAGKKLAPVQQAFVERDAMQCGFCTPGFVVSAHSLLEDNPNPSLEQIKSGLSGNFCRCGTYTRIFEAVQQTARAMRGAK